MRRSVLLVAISAIAIVLGAYSGKAQQPAPGAQLPPGAAAAQPRGPQGGPAQNPVAGTDLARFRRGDIVGRGQKDALSGQCVVQFRFSNPMPAREGEVRRVSLRQDPDCSIVWDQDETLPPRPAQRAQNDNPASVIARLWQKLVPRLEAQSYVYKRASQTVWMYGGGGPPDKLTEVAGYPYYPYTLSNGAYVVFGYNFSTSVRTDAYSYCLPVSYNTGWRHDGCFITQNVYSGPEVSQITEGHFHWAPFDSFHHYLQNLRGGTANGVATANWGWFGSIVWGVTAESWWNYQ